MLHAIAETRSRLCKADPEETEQNRLATIKWGQFLMEPRGRLLADENDMEIVAAVADLSAAL
jgi:hypothetical protein